MIQLIRDFVFLITMITPYLLYTWAFKKPKHFLSCISQDQLVTFSSLLHGTTFITYFCIAISAGFNYDGLYIGLVLIAAGQLLNYLVYKLLGKVRAYYGWEFELDNGPPQNGFPFTLGDAQYKGCMLTVIGFYFCFKSTFELTWLTAVWVFMYFYMILMENTKCGRVIKSD